MAGSGKGDKNTLYASGRKESFSDEFYFFF